MISSIQLAEQCATTLTALGCTAFVQCDESTDGEVALHIPPLEGPDGMLCQRRTYLLVSRMLCASGTKGILLRSPVTGSPVGIFCFHPDTFEPSTDGTDVEFWPSAAGSQFDWDQLVQDDNEWCCGWPVDRGYVVGERIAFIAALLDAEVVNLPRRCLHQITGT
ncbi:hypothetical protein F2S72_09410 [Pseudomonas syringae pv. actinidiae]|nr:hypothetical protein [Pseudomonas syringae pv. actinidiae]